MESIIYISPDMMTDLLDYVAEIFDNLSPFILLIVGVGVGLMVIGVIIKSLRG